MLSTSAINQNKSRAGHMFLLLLLLSPSCIQIWTGGDRGGCKERIIGYLSNCYTWVRTLRWWNDRKREKDSFYQVRSLSIWSGRMTINMIVCAWFSRISVTKVCTAFLSACPPSDLKRELMMFMYMLPRDGLLAPDGNPAGVPTLCKMLPWWPHQSFTFSE